MSKQKHGRMVGPSAQWRAFDQLPIELRQVLARAPYAYMSTPVLRAYKRDGDVRRVRAEMIAGICDDMVKNARKTYGADHPAVTHPVRPR